MTVRSSPAAAASSGPSRAPWWLTPLVTVLCCLILTHADVYAGMKGIIPFNIMVVPIVLAGAWLFLSALSGLVWRNADALLAALVENRVPIAAFLLWAFGYLLFMGDVVLNPLDVDYVELFPIYQLAILLFGMAVATTPGFAEARLFAGKAALLVLGGSIVYDSIVPGTFSQLAHRSSGFSMNANVAAFNLAATLAMSIRYGRFFVSDVVALLFTAVAVFLTFSRSGLAQVGLVVVVYLSTLIAASRTARDSPRLLGGALAVVVLLGTTAFFADDIVQATGVSKLGETSIDARERMDQLLFRGGRKLADDPYRGPLHDYYSRLIYERPLTGHGTGYALNSAIDDAPFGVGPHSMYLRVWADNGVWSLVTYVAFIVSSFVVMLTRRFVPGATLMVLVAAYGFFDHLLIDNKTCLLLTGMALGLSAVQPRQRLGASVP